MLRLKNSLIRAWLIIPAAGLAFLSPAAAIDATIQTRICDQFVGPDIASPVSGMETGDTSLVISGSGEPGLAVSIDDNGANVAVATVAPDGSFALQVPLVDGSNVLVAREINECDTIKQSQAVMVSKTVANQTPPSEPQQPLSVQSSISELSPENLPDQVGVSIMATVTSLGFQKPTITYPYQDGRFIDPRVWVTGRAHAGSVVSIYVNGINAGNVIASDKGVYGQQVGLVSRGNTIQVKSLLADRSSVSDKINVAYVKQEPALATPNTNVVTAVGVVGASTLAGIGVVLWRVPSMRFWGRWK